MPPESDEFEALRRLLACKRYEQPPPAYFRTLSRSIRNRLEEEDAEWAQPWWRQWFPSFELRPLVVGLYGFAISGLLFAGFKLSQFFEHELASVPRVRFDSFAVNTGPQTEPIPATWHGRTAMLEDSVAGYASSLAPTFRAESVPWWTRSYSLPIQPVSYTPIRY